LTWGQCPLSHHHASLTQAELVIQSSSSSNSSNSSSSSSSRSFSRHPTAWTIFNAYMGCMRTRRPGYALPLHHIKGCLVQSTRVDSLPPCAAPPYETMPPPAPLPSPPRPSFPPRPPTTFPSPASALLTWSKFDATKAPRVDAHVSRTPLTPPPPGDQLASIPPPFGPALVTLSLRPPSRL